jgi:diacylglycerol kinase family enzyme
MLHSNFVRPTLVLFPLGTANALFYSLHRPLLPLLTPDPNSPTEMTLALRTLLFGTPHSLPIFRALFSPGARLLTNTGRTALPLPNNTLYGAIVASYGLHATLVADSDTPEWRKHGAQRFGMVARELLAHPHVYRAKLAFDYGSEAQPVWKTVERQQHGYILATLVSNLEKTFTISPASEPLDGKLRVVHFGPLEGEEVGRLMGLAYQGGKHVLEEGVGYEEVRGVAIEFLERDGDGDGMEGRWRRVCIDGLIVRVEEGGRMEVREVREEDRVLDVVVGWETRLV